MGDDADEDDEDDYDDDNGISTHQTPRYYLNINPKNGILVVVVLITHRRTASVEGAVGSKLKI